MTKYLGEYLDATRIINFAGITGMTTNELQFKVYDQDGPAFTVSYGLIIGSNACYVPDCDNAAAVLYQSKGYCVKCVVQKILSDRGVNE